MILHSSAHSGKYQAVYNAVSGIIRNEELLTLNSLLFLITLHNKTTDNIENTAETISAIKRQTKNVCWITSLFGCVVSRSGRGTQWDPPT